MIYFSKNTRIFAVGENSHRVENRVPRFFFRAADSPHTPDAPPHAVHRRYAPLLGNPERTARIDATHAPPQHKILSLSVATVVQTALSPTAEKIE